MNHFPLPTVVLSAIVSLSGGLAPSSLAQGSRAISAPKTPLERPNPFDFAPTAPTPKPAATPVPRRAVRLTHDVDVPVVSGGKSIGSMTLTKGREFKVTAETPKTVTVQNGRLLHVLKREWTDIDRPASAK